MLLWLIYLLRPLIRIPNARCLVADDAFVKRGFQRRKSNFDRRCNYICGGYGAKNIWSNFL